ncbi:hypothetical protein KSP39_PZI019431 [Platanthera zijinensis]|uniref:Uncharacterized protein n=1 Tax=Platanthera zijinensis TaxID=2320716 RepID=A0AAP0B375_9ASPA
MASSYFPLHWESTGGKWWYASPIDLAAANGHYDLVRELLHLDMNLLMKLTSLRRIRRLETVWDDDNEFVHAARNRSFVARNLLFECETKNNKNSLIRAGYGGWLMYTAAAAGDDGFLRELLERDPLLVFGEGEYGVADILYAAARSKKSEAFKTIFDLAISPAYLVGDGGGSEEDLGSGRDGISVFRSEMVNRAVLAAARGGSLEVLKELIGKSSDVLAYRDSQGATILHASAGSGQVEVVNHLVDTFNIIECRDNQGNTALHIAAFRAHASVVEVLISASSTLPYSTNNEGDTFLHTAVAGFQSPGFRRVDLHMELIRRLMYGNIVDICGIINLQNINGRAALHAAVIGTLHSDLVELLMTVPSIDINVRDTDGMTPLDLLRRRVYSASSKLLIKKFVLAGGKSNSNQLTIQSAISSQLKIHSGFRNSPGTSFRIADSELFLYTGIEAAVSSGRLSSSSTEESENQNNEKRSSFNTAARGIRALLGFSIRKEKKNGEDSYDSPKDLAKWRDREEIPTPLRQTLSNGTSLMNNKRAVSIRASTPSPATKKTFAASLMHGVFQAMPLVSSFSKPQTPLSSFSCSQISSPVSEKLKDCSVDSENGGDFQMAGYSRRGKSSSLRSGFMKPKFMNKNSSFPPVG